LWRIKKKILKMKVYLIIDNREIGIISLILNYLWKIIKYGLEYIVKIFRFSEEELYIEISKWKKF